MLPAPNALTMVAPSIWILFWSNPAPFTAISCRGLTKRSRVAYSAGGSRFQTHNRGVIPGGQRLVTERRAIHDSAWRRFGGFQEFLIGLHRDLLALRSRLSMERSRTGVSVTLTMKDEETSAVLKPAAEKRTR